MLTAPAHTEWALLTPEDDSKEMHAETYATAPRKVHFGPLATMVILKLSLLRSVQMSQHSAAEVVWWGGSHPYHGVLVWSDHLNRWHSPRDRQSSILSQSFALCLPQLALRLTLIPSHYLIFSLSF